MALLIGFTGLSGSGKTTAIGHLQRLTAGQIVYLGKAVLLEIERRGLPPGPESEQSVRFALRQKHGPSAFVSLARRDIQGHLCSGTNVLVDAILSKEEFEAFQECRGESECVLIAIEASFEIRCQRLLTRKGRRFTREELESRDRAEMTTLGIMATMAMADYSIANEGSLEDFERALESIWSSLPKPAT